MARIIGSAAALPRRGAASSARRCERFSGSTAAGQRPCATLRPVLGRGAAGGLS